MFTNNNFKLPNNMDKFISNLKNDTKDQPPFFKSLREIKEYDRVELATPVEQIAKELERFNPITKTEDLVQYRSPLSEYVLKYRTGFSHGSTRFDAVCFTYINEAEGIIESYNLETITGLYYCVFRMDSTGEGFTYKMNKATDKECQMALAQIMSVIGYIEHQMLDTNTVVKSERKKRSPAGSSSVASTPKQKRTVKVLNADRVVYSVLSQQDHIAQTLRKYQRHTKSWTVAGHPRKLASGKVVWVRPYKKGEGKVDPKTYIVK